MKKIMILGAGVYQVPLIKKAKELGFYVIVSTIRGNYPGLKFADKIYYADTKDYESILKIAKEEKIDGILTTGTDVAMISVGKINQEMHLNGITFDTATKCTDKLRMKEMFSSEVNHSKFEKVKITDNIVLPDYDYPYMLKAVDSSGSRGIFKIANESEVENAIDSIRKVTKKDYFLCEEFIEGHEIGCEALVYNGEVKFIVPHDKIVYHSNSDVPLGHIFPYSCSENELNEIQNQMTFAINSLGINNCVVNADIIISNEKPYIIEIGARAGATGIPELMSIYLGVNYYELMLNLCLGKYDEIELSQKKVAISKLLHVEKTGILLEQYVNNYDDFTNVNVDFDYNIGDRVDKFVTGQDRIGQIVVYGDSLEEVSKKLSQVEKSIVLKIGESL